MKPKKKDIKLLFIGGFFLVNLGIVVFMPLPLDELAPLVILGVLSVYSFILYLSGYKFW